MAASIAVEEESGVFSGHVHPHDGYYAGEFGVSYPTVRAWDQDGSSFQHRTA